MHEVKLPQLGQSVEEASIVTWYKAEGDVVSEGERLYSVQTDKAEIECESPASGVLRKILVDVDVVIPVLSVVAFVGAADEAIPELAASSPRVEPAVEAGVAAVSAGPSGVVAPGRGKPSVGVVDRPAASPRASATAAALGVTLTGLQGSGPKGRILESDVLAAAQGGNGQPLARRAKPAAGIAGTLEPLTPMRRTVAQRMTASKFSAPHFYETVEVDMSACIALRNGGLSFKPSFNDFVLAAAVEALGAFTHVNAQWTDEGVYVFGEINLGFAVALDSGLIVPVIRNVGGMDLESIHAAASELAAKARENKLTPDEYSGATFTVSNLGAYGIDEFTAIINPPGSAILAVGRIAERPAVVDGKIQIRPIMRVTLSSDHRVIDGALAAQFLGAVKLALETCAFAQEE